MITQNEIFQMSKITLPENSEISMFGQKRQKKIKILLLDDCVEIYSFALDE